MSTKPDKSPTPPSLIDQILFATEADLQAIDEQIAAITDEIAEKQRTVDGFRAIRKAIEIRINGKPERKKREPREPGDDTPKQQLSDAVFDLLTKEGSMPVPAIAERLGKTPAIIGMAIGRKSEWFVRKNGEVHIATT